MGKSFPIERVKENWRPLDPVEGEKLIVLPPLNEAALASARDLLKAETIGAIYQTPFPLAVAPLTQPISTFADYFTNEDIGDAARRARINRQGWVGHVTNIASDSPRPIDAVKVFREPIAQNILFNNAVGHPWKAQIFVYRSDLMPHGNWLHFDQPEGAPSDLIWLAVSANPTRFVPHAVTQYLLSRSEFAPVLDYRLDDPKLQEKMQFFNNKVLDNPTDKPAILNLRQDLRDAMVEMTAGHIHIMTGMDVHEQAHEIAPGRVCSKMVTNFNPHHNWKPYMWG